MAFQCCVNNRRPQVPLLSEMCKYTTTNPPFLDIIQYPPICALVSQMCSSFLVSRLELAQDSHVPNASTNYTELICYHFVKNPNREILHFPISTNALIIYYILV